MITRPRSWRAAWILIVEDDEVLARAIARSFRRWGVANVIVVNDVGAARLAIQRPFLRGALIDVVLPDGSGIDLAIELRAAQPLAEYLIWSGTRDMSIVERANRQGFHFIAKGGDEALLADAAARWGSGDHGATPVRLAVDRQLASIRASTNLTDRQAATLEHALELRSYKEIAAARGVTLHAVEQMSARIEERTGRTLAQWSVVMRKLLRTHAPVGAGRRRR